MLQAVKRFDTDRGFRITTYAIWWVRAAIQEYILRSWMAEVAIPRRLFADTLRLVVRLRASPAPA
jgi:RNA polymerase sigma-32 factor